MFFLCFLSYGGIVSIGTFLTNYISDILKIGVHESDAFSAFYLGRMLVGKLLGAIILKTIKPSYVLEVCVTANIILITVSMTSEGN